jgi:two-component system, OmpR family, response regulator
MNRHALRSAVVIEDDEGIRSLVCAVLQRAGLTVVEASNGLDGVEAVRANAPAVVTVDIRMPGIDGFETTRRIREISDATIIVLSAHVADADESESLRAGADVYVQKPFRPRELSALVEEHLGAAGAQRAARSRANERDAGAGAQAVGRGRVSSSIQANRPSAAISPNR